MIRINAFIVFLALVSRNMVCACATVFHLLRVWQKTGEELHINLVSLCYTAIRQAVYVSILLETMVHFTQWQGATIELPGFESLVVQVSKAQCLILIDPSEALDLAGQLGKQVEKRYPALLDKIHRVIFLAQRRSQMSDREFLQIFKEGSAYHSGRNIL